MALARVEGGFTEREHLEGMWKRTGKKPPELEPLPLPQLLGTWVAYRQLSLRRQKGGRMSWSDILAWATLTHRKLTPNDLRGIALLEGVYAEVRGE